MPFHSTAVSISLLLGAVMGFPVQSANADSKPHSITVSGTLLGKMSMVGVEIEAVITPQVRIGVGAGVAALGRGILSIPVFVSWYPWGTQTHGMYVDAGVNILRLSACCGGAIHGGSDTEYYVRPDVGIGYALHNENLLFKAGIDVAWIADKGWYPWPIPGVRAGYNF